MWNVNRFGWTLSIAALLLLLPVQGTAQVALGISGGVTSSNFSGDDVDDDDFDSRTGLLLGGFATFGVSDILSVSSGLYYSQKGAADNSSGGDATLKMDYLEIPLLLHVGVFEGESAAASLFAGPALAFEVACELEGSGGGVSATVDCDSDAFEEAFGETESFQLSVVFGAGLRFMTSETMFFLVNGGLDLGLTSVDGTDAPDDVKHSTWFGQAGVGWIVGG